MTHLRAILSCCGCCHFSSRFSASVSVPSAASPIFYFVVPVLATFIRMFSSRSVCLLQFPLFLSLFWTFQTFTSFICNPVQFCPFSWIFRLNFRRILDFLLFYFYFSSVSRFRNLVWMSVTKNYKDLRIFGRSLVYFLFNQYFWIFSYDLHSSDIRWPRTILWFDKVKFSELGRF